MDHYYVNDRAQDTGEHEVHKAGCKFFPDSTTDLGKHANCHGAIEKAKEIYSNVDGCYYCSRDCHTR